MGLIEFNSTKIVEKTNNPGESRARAVEARGIPLLCFEQPD
jgi:hypothetical protein